MDESWSNLLKKKWSDAAKEGYLGSRAKVSATKLSIAELKELRKKRKQYGG